LVARGRVVVQFQNLDYFCFADFAAFSLRALRLKALPAKDRKAFAKAQAQASDKLKLHYYPWAVAVDARNLGLLN
jgi:hypothetical protein